MPQEEKKHISTTTGLLIILAAAVIIGGGAIAYFYVNSPTSWDYMGQKTAVHKSSNANTNTSNTNSTTADWKTYAKDSNSIGFKYPSDWGNAILDNGKVKVETGYSYNIAFSTIKDISMGYTSTDMSAGREGTMYEMIAINKNVAKINNCATYKQYVGSDYVTSCKDITKNNKTIGIIVVLDYPADSMAPGSYTAGYYFTGIDKFPVVGLSTNNKLTATSDTFENIIKLFF